MRHAFLLGCALSVLSACVATQPGDDLERSDLTLSFAAQQPNLPEPEDLPDCWWAEEDETCEYECGEGPRRPEPPARIKRALTLSTGATTPARAIDDLTIKQCPFPDGVVLCPHCNRLSLFPTIASFALHPAVSTRVVLANYAGAYRVVSMPQLNAQVAASLEPGAEWGDTPILIDLDGGEVLEEGGDLSFAEDLFLLFSVEGGDDSAVPADYWVECPKNGAQCQTVLL